MTETLAKQSITNLLRYAEEILKINERVITDLTKFSSVIIHEQDVLGLDGVTVNPQDGSWIRFARLRETPPPAADPMFEGWVVQPSSLKPFDMPRLLDERLLRLPIEAASDLIEAGLADFSDVMAPREQDVPDKVDVLLRTSNLPEFLSLFSEYVNGPWSEWAKTERPRRKSIAFYNKLFAVQQRMMSLGDDVPEECVIGVGQARWKHPLGNIDIPLIEATVELSLDPDDGSIQIIPRTQPPKMCLRAFQELEIGGVGRLDQETSEQLSRSYNDPDVGFSPFEKFCFETPLRACSARLSSSSVYEPDVREDPNDRSPPIADDKLRITDTWVFYVRQRSVDFRCSDIRKLIDRVREAPDDDVLPGPAVRLTVAGPDEAIDGEDGGICPPEGLDASSFENGLSGQGRASGTTRAGVTSPKFSDRILFPLPFNTEQKAIIQRLEDAKTSGVVVQGPPGTGKTHTIANIICHYMATGRRVLVTARTPEALTAIQEKLPPDIRDLAIAVIHSDRLGGQQLEKAIGMLSNQIKQIDLAEYKQLCADKERRLAEVESEIASIDDAIREYATINLAPITYRGESLLPMDLSAKIEADRSRHAWLPDRLPAGSTSPLFSDSDIAEAQSIRKALGSDIIYRADQLPDRSKLPDVPTLLAAHEAISAAQKAQAKAKVGELPMPSLTAQAGAEEAESLLAWLEPFSSWYREAEGAAIWLLDLYRLLIGAVPSENAVREGMRRLCAEWVALTQEGSNFFLRGIEVPDITPDDAPFNAAVEALALGRRPFGLLPFGKSKLRASVERVRLEGRAPASTQDWKVVHDYRQWQQRVQLFVGQWSAAARALGHPPLPQDWKESHREFQRLGRHVQSLHNYHLEAEKHFRLVAALFPYGVDARRVVHFGEATLVCEALSRIAQRTTHGAADALKRYLDSIPCDTSLPFWQALDEIRSAIGTPDVQARDLANGWLRIVDEAERLSQLSEKRTRLEKIAMAVEQSGAPIWASMLLTQKCEPGNDRWTPSDWRDTWEWASVAEKLRSISDRADVTRLTTRRVALEHEQRQLLREIVRLNTFVGLRRGITTSIATALAKFAVAVRRLGGGTGKTAELHRRAIREAALEAAGAVPCWILPEWRVAEQLPSELAIFDLVIIDEASQSDITALPAVMRAKKLLIVGDDRQVSPSAVGIQTNTVIQLRETFLRGMPIANYLDPSTSMYDLAAIMFPGTTVMLREHFRCVEPIIRFSSRLCYDDKGGLVPLRVPTTDERLDPPLIDVYVRSGKKDRDVNLAEADFIIEEIKNIANSDALANRSIGVISLIGDKQAKYINDRLSTELGFEAMTRHRIMCGNASTFQGQERDIMFLSMVACPSTVRAQTTKSTEQRFNVAMSRARDRVYLVRSVAASMLSPHDLKLSILKHFQNPMGDAAVPQPEDVLDLCESPFERDVGAQLLKLGYRARPQVSVGGYRIDFVIEGTGDRRLAVELDGDKFHGPDKWLRDLYRQRALERMGWKFWRCWGSHWTRDRNACLEDLLSTLAKMGIEPVGGDFSPFVYVEHRILGETASGESFEENLSGSVDEPDTRGQAPPPQEVVSETLPKRDLSPYAGDLVAPGDTVIVRFDDNRVRRFRLSPDAHSPDEGIVHVHQPIGKALLGNGVDEEVEFTVDGKTRTALIEKIVKPKELAAAE